MGGGARSFERQAQLVQELEQEPLGGPEWELEGVTEYTADQRGVTKDVQEQRRTVNSPPPGDRGREAFATTEEIGMLFRVHAKTVERWRKSLGLPCLRLGGRVRYDVSEVLRWASARKEVA